MQIAHGVDIADLHVHYVIVPVHAEESNFFTSFFVYCM